MYETIQTKYENTSVRITWTPHGNDVTTVRGYPINSKTGVKLDGYCEVKRKASNNKEIEITKDYVYHAVLDKLKPKKREKSSSSDGSIDYESAIVQTFFKLKESGMVVNNNKWASSTQEAAMAYIEHNVLSKIQHCQNDDDFGPNERFELREDMVEYALSNERSHNQLENAYVVANKHLYEAQVIYNAMLEMNPSLPDLKINDEVKRTRTQTEQRKSIPAIVDCRLRSMVEALVAVDPKLARGVALLISGGLRPAEAAATEELQCLQLDDCIVVEVLYQEQKGERIARLKSDSGYRRVVLDEWGSIIVNRCNALIRDGGNGKQSVVRGADISKWTRAALKQCGCDEVYIKDAMQTMKSKPEYGQDGLPDFDVAAYILRRNRASVWKNICGFTQDEIDYLLGHRRIQKGHRPFNPQDLDVLREWIRKNSRYDILPKMSSNPLHKPIQLVHGTEMEIIPFNTVRLANVSLSPLRVTISIDAAEPGEMIKIKTKGRIDSDRSISRKARKRKTAEIIGRIAENDREGSDDEEA